MTKIARKLQSVEPFERCVDNVARAYGNAIVLAQESSFCGDFERAMRENSVVVCIIINWFSLSPTKTLFHTQMSAVRAP